MIHSHAEAVKLMSQGKILKNLPPDDWLDYVTQHKDLEGSISPDAKDVTARESNSNIIKEKDTTGDVNQPVDDTYTPYEAVL